MYLYQKYAELSVYSHHFESTSVANVYSAWKAVAGKADEKDDKMMIRISNTQSQNRI